MKYLPLVLILGCATAPLPPSPLNKMPVCIITCPAGVMFRPQHICKSDRRWFQDAIASDERVMRGADGGILSDTIVTTAGDYDARDVERGTCSAFISRTIASRPSDERGVHPGEDGQGNPLNPPKK